MGAVSRRSICAVPESVAWVVGGLLMLAAAVLTVQRRWWV